MQINFETKISKNYFENSKYYRIYGLLNKNESKKVWFLTKICTIKNDLFNLGTQVAKNIFEILF